MTGGRMRRVDEAMREVLSGAITSELKDPRVGFVTVTAVKTSPDLRHARVYVSVLGAAEQRTATLVGLRSPTAISSAGWPTSCGSSTRRRWPSTTTTAPSAGCGSRS